MLIAKEAEQGNGGPCKLGAAGGSFDAEEGGDGVEEFFVGPLFNREHFAAQPKENGDLLPGRLEDVSVVDKEGDNVRVPLGAFVSSGGCSNNV